MRICIAKRRLWLALFGLFVALLSLGSAGCGDGNGTASTATQPPTTSPSSATPEVTPTLAPAPPIAQASELKLRLVNVATGNNTDLPVEFGLSRAWSPDSTRIAVAAEDGVWVGATTAGAFTQIWQGSCRGVDWSPTQDRIAAACKDGVVILGLKGEVLARDQSATADWVHWSPDGKVVAYGSYTGAVGLIQIDGTRKTIAGFFMGAQWLADGRLATIEQPDYRWAATIRIHDPGNDYAVVSQIVTRAAAYALAINRQGDFAAYSVYGQEVAGSRILPSTLYVVAIPGGQEVPIVGGYASYLAAGNGPAAFSPDGRSVLMQTDFCKPTWSLDIAGVDGSARAIAHGSFMVTKFSPDGSLVAYAAGTELWVGASDGSSAPRRIAPGVHGPAGFEWSPDSKWISVPPYFGGFGQCEGS